MSAVRILPLGGLGEIGMNCMAIEYQDEILILDCGLMFSDLDHLGVEFVIPDFKYLIERRDKVRGIIITHGHEDHIGAIPFAIKSGINAPIFATPFSSLLIRHRLKEHGFESTTSLITLLPGQKAEFEHFKVQTQSVNHSIIDSVALFIDTPAGKIIHTGDFKIDSTPYYGSQIDLDAFAKAGDEGVLLLMSDSTNVERCTAGASESAIYPKFEELFAAAQGLTLVSMFASNVARMGQLFEAAHKVGKRVVLAGRTMENNTEYAQSLGYLPYAQSVLLSLDDIRSQPRNKVIVLSTGSQGEFRSSLARISQGEHKQIKLQKGDLVLMSSKAIPGNEKSVSRMVNDLFRQGAEVLYESVHELHTSGHATKPELKQILSLVRPKFFIPVHGEYRHLVHHARLAVESGVPEENTLVIGNYDLVELTPNSLKKIETIENERVLVEGRDGNDISRLMIKDRRQLGEKGVVFSIIVRNSDTRKVISGPEIIARGLVTENQEGWMIEEAKAVVKSLIQDYETALRVDAAETDLQEDIRIHLRRFFNQNIGRKPVVLSMILDI